jgi:hypothetical protein
MHLRVVTIDPIKHMLGWIDLHATRHVVSREQCFACRPVEIRAKDRAAAEVAPINFSGGHIQVHEVRPRRRGVGDDVGHGSAIERRALNSVLQLIAPVEKLVP